MTKNTGGPAFPHSFVAHPTEETFVAKGMTLRDYFAAKAMVIVMPPIVEEISKRNISDSDVKKLKQLSAEACYGMADAMLKARDQ